MTCRPSMRFTSTPRTRPCWRIRVIWSPGWSEPFNLASTKLSCPNCGEPARASRRKTTTAPGEPVVIKHRYSAMHNTELDAILKRHGIRSLLLSGISTDTCVESLACQFSFPLKPCRMVLSAVWFVRSRRMSCRHADPGRDRSTN